MKKEQTEAERVAAWRQEKLDAGDRMLTVRLSKKAAQNLDKLAITYGGKRAAVEIALEMEVLSMGIYGKASAKPD
jgi:hypothetical protein